VIAVANEKDNELSIFIRWLKGGLLPIDINDLTRYDPITKSLHAQWERLKLKDGVMHRRYWEGREEEDSWQLVSPIEYSEEIMRTAHASVTGGHMGVKKTQMKVAKTSVLGWMDERRSRFLPEV